MKSSFFSFCFVAFLFVTLTVVAQQALSEDIVFKIKDEAFQRSQIEALSFYLTDYAGPRLSASKLGERAEKLTKEKLIQLGFSNARIEHAADFPRGGWDNLKTYAAMTEPYYSNLTALPRAWSGSTNGLVQGEVILLDIKTQEDIEKYKGKLNNKIILMPETQRHEMRFTPYATRYTDEQLKELTTVSVPQSRPPFDFAAYEAMIRLQRQTGEFLVAEKPAVIISGGGVFNVPQSWSISETYKYGDAEPIAELILPIEHHGRLVRLKNKNISVSMEVEIKNEFYNNQVINNVIAEIHGTDPILKNEVVLIGAHLDTWHGGTGATDNAAGCAVMIEAMRIIKETGIKPRRTIRIALWGGHEYRGIGSTGYMQSFLFDTNGKKIKEGYDQFALYLNMDNGSGKFRGIYLEENDKAFPFFEEWIKPLNMDFGVLSPRKRGGTDHVIFDGIGLPAFQFIQDELEYWRGHHTAMDTYERLIIDDLKYNAAVIAFLALSAAMDDSKIPPKPIP